MTDLKAIEALHMCRELMLFDPMTGEDILLDQLNQDNRDLYDACEATDWRVSYLACGLYNMPFEALVPHRRPLVEVRTRRQKEDEMISGQIEL